MPSDRVFRALSAAGLRLAAALLLAVAATLASTSLAGAQGGCRAVEDLGRLDSYTTLNRTGLLHASSCRAEGVRYYDKYLFELPGAGDVSVSLRAADFSGRLVFNTGGGEYLAHSSAYYDRTWLSRTLPAGSYLLLVVSEGNRDAGSYTVTIETKRIEAPPPVKEPDPPPVNEPNPPTGGGQTPQGGSTTTGRVVARVHALPAGDSRGAYRIEFGFFTDAVLAGAASRSAAIRDNAGLLPESRWLSAAVILRRAAGGNRGWLRSSPIRIGGGASEVTGRVIVRWNPASGGVLRLEFGFLPEWTFGEAGGSVAQAAARHASLLPDSRYLTEAGIAAERRSGVARWLFSSEVRVPPPPQLPTEGSLEQGEEAGTGGEDANPALDLTSLSGLTSYLGSSLTTASALITGLERLGAVPGGLARIYVCQNSTWLFFGVADSRELPGSYDFEVVAPEAYILWISTSANGEPPDASDVCGPTDDRTATPTEGEEPVIIPPPEEPVRAIRVPSTRFARCGGDTIKVYWFDTVDHTRYHLDMPWEAAQRIIPRWGEQLISHLSQADCDDWTLGSPLNERETCRIVRPARCG